MIKTRRWPIAAIFPFLLAVMVMIGSSHSLALPYVSASMPLCLMMIIYYWSIYYPELLPSWSVLLLGFIEDALWGRLFGVGALIYFSLSVILKLQRRHLVKESFVIVWLSFSFFLIPVAVAMYLIHSLHYQMIFLDFMILVQIGVTFVLYPLMHRLCQLVHSRVAGGWFDA
jgi:rod shape-determining protein MreD